MRHPTLVWATLALLLSACSPDFGLTAARSGATIDVRVTGPFAVQARPRVVSDIDHYTFKLIRTSDSTVQKSGTSSNLATQFTAVPDGTYQLTAEAFASVDDSVSITVGGPQTSTNSVTVASSGTGPFVVYSAGTALSATLMLLGGTGETIANQLTVNDGTAYAGAIGFIP